MGLESSCQTAHPHLDGVHAACEQFWMARQQLSDMLYIHIGIINQ